MAIEIDEVDKRIISLLLQNPEVSQSEIAEVLKTSQPAISTRISKLKNKGILSYSIGTDVKKAQLFLAKIDIITDDTEQILNFMDKCPLYFNAFLTSGRYNLTVLMIGENLRSITSCMNHMRQNAAINKLIKDVEFNFVVASARNFIVPVKPNLDKKKITPCGKDCDDCTFYMNDRCLGCPASIKYKGTLL